MNNLNRDLNHPMAFPLYMPKVVPVEAVERSDKSFYEDYDEEITMSVDDFKLKGRSRVYSSLAAASSAHASSVKKVPIRQSLISIGSVEHRAQHVATVKGIEFINDSGGTNVNCTWFALEGINKPVVLILGGVDNGNDYRILFDLVKEKVKAIICLGLSNEKIHNAFERIVATIIDTDNADDAVNAAYSVALKGDVVLMSPGCASFDLFKNYEDRGEQFIRAVKKL